MVINRFTIFLVRLDPKTGAETAKTRPCVVVSSDEVNRAIATVIIAPAAIGIGDRGGDDVNEVSGENIVALCDVDSQYVAKRFSQFPQRSNTATCGKCWKRIRTKSCPRGRTCQGSARWWWETKEKLLRFTRCGRVKDYPG